MRLEYDREADAAYLYLVANVGPGASARVIVCDLDARNASVHLDIDRDGRILGIEMLGASQLLHAETLETAHG